jgi:hypothetical protein
MLPFSGITLQQKMGNISELLGGVWWMGKWPYSATWHPRLKNCPSLYKISIYTQGNKFKIVE